MTTRLDQQIQALVNTRAFVEALSKCSDALAEAEEEERPLILRLRAYVHGYMKNHEAEVADLTAALADTPGDARLLFERSRGLIELHRFSEAVADLEKLVEHEEANDSVWYLGIARCLQAVCLVQQHKAEEALASCARLDADASVWILRKLHTRDELVREARAILGLNRKRKP